MAKQFRGTRQPGWMAPLALLAGAVMSLNAQAGDLEVSEARMRVLPGEMPAAGYFQLHNGGEGTVVLVGAHSAAFGHVELHRSMSHDGMASMEAVEQVELAAGESIEFAPQGYHLMLMQPAGEVAVGESVEIVLNFEQAEPLSVDFEAVPPTSL
ncbi:copper chaperone PCu(A)C [Halomonas sp. 18H]|uniref:copper chaperone PCu(A)C n=1 Tax=Halomonas almeriensis TaxID=308163 RepID=UPI00222F13F0|nr:MULTISPECIES: copper chaperone PCu(A)C [Halomonas]MCW4151781.1 copper chaperone PCu(A)C [Halomonas sp. 18H]MDN3554027.1 copper chaperone PCu(A)C [Halomonas almeriensis]